MMTSGGLFYFQKWLGVEEIFICSFTHGPSYIYEEGGNLP